MTTDKPSAGAMTDIIDRLKEACNGHPHAKIEWPHRLLHDAMAEIATLRRPPVAGAEVGVKPVAWAYYHDGQMDDETHPIIERRPRASHHFRKQPWTEVPLYSIKKPKSKFSELRIATPEEVEVATERNRKKPVDHDSISRVLTRDGEDCTLDLRTVTIVLPEGYQNAEDFAQDCGFELAASFLATPVAERGGGGAGEQHETTYLRGWNEGIESAVEAMPTTAENPNEDAYQRGKFDGVMEYQRTLRTLVVPSTARTPTPETGDGSETRGKAK